MSHTHNHTHGLESTGTRLILTMVLNFVITIAEIIGGIISGSLSLISDALHNFSDGVSVILSYLALKLKSRKRSDRHTFGLKRAEILAAVINSSVLLGISVYLFYHASLRLFHPQEIHGGLMTIVASIGLVANILGTLLLKRDAQHSLNIKSSYLHLLGDVLSSVSVILGGLAIYFWKIYWLDPVLTILLGIYILKESYKILLQAIHVLMEGAPEDVSLEAVKEAVESIPKVNDLHHIHLWTVGENDIHLEAHINIEDMLISQSDELRKNIESILKEKFRISHIVLQLECDQCKQIGLIKK